MNFSETANGKRVADRVRSEIANGWSTRERLLANLDTVTENLYQSLPSGDYGRGDVRRAIEQALGKETQ